MRSQDLSKVKRSQEGLRRAEKGQEETRGALPIRAKRSQEKPREAK